MTASFDSRPHGYKVLRDVLHRRHSERVAFDPQEPPSGRDVEAILDSARWAPTAHNMQNFEIVVVDRKETLSSIARIGVVRSDSFLKESAAQLSWTEEELMARGTGLLATMFPSSWWPEADDSRSGVLGTGHVSDDGRTAPGVSEAPHGFLREGIRDSPMVLVVLYDASTRAPGSEGDFLGIVSLGCVLENMWLTATSLGISMEIVSVCGDPDVEREMRTLLAFPDRLQVAFVCRLGYPATPPVPSLRVRRPIERFVHWNRYQPVEARAT